MVVGRGASVIYADTVRCSIVSHCFYLSHISLTLWFLIGFKNFMCFSFHVQVGDLGYASELGNYAEYSGAPNEEEVLYYARVLIDVRKP